MRAASGFQGLISNSSHLSPAHNSTPCVRSLDLSTRDFARLKLRQRYFWRSAPLVEWIAWPPLRPSPTTLIWAAVPVGGIGAQKTVTLTNTSGASITISSLTLSGANAGDFKIFSKTCSTSLATAASCTANIVFAPTTTGTRTAILNFNDSAGTQTVALSGNGTAPRAASQRAPRVSRLRQSLLVQAAPRNRSL